MTLIPGARLGPYEILSPLGAGGMGEVYKARDTKLDRAVAIKILPEAFVSDPERVARFQREAKTLASLNHPNIGGIHGLEQSGGVTALVMELVEGEDLSQRIARGAILIDEALPIARQIAEALEAAHEQGVIHRDLKPANIKVRPDGTVKVLDFGLAKAMEPVGSAPHVSQSPTITTPAMMTGVGVILGTAAYMSPEQAKGKPADKRADIWAFGAVLFEMLTGKRAFDGEDVGDTLAAVLRAEPDWNALPAEAAFPVRTLLRGCLEKDPRQRIADISAALFVLRHQAPGTAIEGRVRPRTHGGAGTCRGVLSHPGAPHPRTVRVSPGGGPARAPRRVIVYIYFSARNAEPADDPPCAGHLPALVARRPAHHLYVDTSGLPRAVLAAGGWHRQRRAAPHACQGSPRSARHRLVGRRQTAPV